MLHPRWIILCFIYCPYLQPHYVHEPCRKEIWTKGKLFSLQQPNQTTWVRYSWSMYRAVAFTLAAGFDFYHPPTLLIEVWIAKGSYWTGRTLYALFVGRMNEMLQGINISNRRYAQKVNIVYFFPAQQNDAMASVFVCFISGFQLYAGISIWYLWPTPLTP